MPGISHIISLCRRGLLGGFIDQPTQGYNGNMPSRWVRIVGVRGTGLGPAWGLVVRRVPLGAGPTVFEIDPGFVACLGFIPPTVVHEAVKVRRLRMSGPSQLPP